MEYNNNLSTDFASLRDISSTQMNALLNIDSPPETPLDPTQMQLSQSSRLELYSCRATAGGIVEQSVGISAFSHKERTTREDVLEDSNVDCSVLRFNNQPLDDSQLNSQIDFSIFNQVHPNDDNLGFSQPFSLTSGSVKEVPQSPKNVEASITVMESEDIDVAEASDNLTGNQTSDILNTQEIENLDLGELCPGYGEQIQEKSPTEIENEKEFHSPNKNRESMDSVIITSPDIDHITLEDTELMEILEEVELQEKSFNTNRTTTSFKRDIPEGNIKNVDVAISKEPTSNEKENEIPLDFSSDGGNDYCIENATSTKQTEGDFVFTKPEARIDLFKKPTDVINKPGTNKVSEKPSTVPNFDDIEMEELDDIDFEQLNALERAYSRKVDRQCETQLDINSVRPSITEKMVPSCPPPHLRPLIQTPTESKHPMDYLELNYSKSSSVQSSQDLPSLQSSINILNQAMDASSNQKNSTAESARTFDIPNKSNANKEETPKQQTIPSESARTFDIPSKSNDGKEKSNSPLPNPELNISKTSSAKTDTSKSSTTSLPTRLRINKSTTDATMMPLSVKQLYDVIKEQYSDFAFIYALSAQLCQDRVPMDCFVTLKMGLLLSLASIGLNPDIPPIPIIAIGNDTYMTNYLMTTVGQMATRFIGPTEDTKPPSSNGYRNHQWIEADPLILAQGGVYYVGDWSRLKLLRADKLYKDLESSMVTISSSSAHQYPLQAAVWAHWRSFQYNTKDHQMFNKFMKIFGIPIYVADDNHETLINYILEQASVRTFESTIDHLSISSKDMTDFVVNISQRCVDHTPEASDLLQKYFVATRTARPDCLTKQGLTVLKQFSESFAKLCLRHEVLPIDVLSSIILCEHSIGHIFGVSDNPPPQFGAVPFVTVVDEYVAQFKQWLDDYIEKYYKD
ncbi:uncharacterized protein [Musca autumnalis]|uniref:uncharacterized protein n=1 Tax=Musca autumnalis TaxID=221902 RepID=UPI003CFB3CAA